MQLEPLLGALESVMEGLKQHLDSRVYVALGRGLWDCTARDVFRYTEALQEGRENRVRPSLSAACGEGITLLSTAILSTA